MAENKKVSLVQAIKENDSLVFSVLAMTFALAALSLNVIPWFLTDWGFMVEPIYPKTENKVTLMWMLSVVFAIGSTMILITGRQEQKILNSDGQ